LLILGLKKAYLELYEIKLENGKEVEKKLKTINVLFNPNTLTFSEGVEYHQMDDVVIKKELRTKKTAQFVRNSPRKLDLQLFYDTFTSIKPEKEDVSDYITELKNMICLNEQMGRPPKVKFKWGSIIFEGYVEKFDYNYILFDSNGKPVRATVDINIVDYAIS